MSEVEGWAGEYPAWVTGFRETQLAAAEQIIDAFDRGIDVVILDAPVGAGKSLVAEMVRQKIGGKGTYVCSGLGLQDQLLRDFDEARVLKGRSNYPTLSGGFTNAGDCLGKDCNLCVPKTDCPYICARKEAMESQIAVLNTSYLVTFRGETYIRPLVVMDEADLIEDALMRHAEFTVTQGRMRVLGVSAPVKAARKSTLRRWLERDFIPAAEKWRGKNKPGPGDIEGRRAFDRLTKEIEQAKEIAAELGDDDKAGEWVRDYPWGRNEGDLVLKPVTVKRQGAEKLWNRGKKDGQKNATKWLCMSGTIISPDEWADSCGVDEAGLSWEVVSVPMMFPVANRPIVLKMVANMARGGEESDRKNLLDNIHGLIDRHAGENILIHAVSYKLMETIVKGLRDRGVRGVMSYYTAGDRELALRRFKEEGGVIVAPSLDRGVDLPDDLCRVCVVAKMPFANLGDRQISERLRSEGGQTWYAVKTTRTLVQMVGRGVRHEEDWCRTYILDKNFAKYYQQWGKRLLPGWFQDAIQGDS